jgi:glyoxylase-like metal-dependent hydrolase (beta-lactamase superfamily II)
MNIHILDTNFQGMPQVTAVYLLVGPDGPVLIETGPGSTLTAVLDGLAAYGFKPGDVRHILLTHIHLDHAGAAGWWAQQGAQIYVHHLGGPHLIDPRRLIQSATRIYESRMETLWGEILPAPAERVTLLYDGDVVRAGGLTFTALDTPGHANHHHTYVLETEFLRAESSPPNSVSKVAFTGDAAGVCLPMVNVVDLPAPPPEFHMETWLATLDRLEAEQFHTIYPTHFGPLTDVHGHLRALRTLMIDSVAFVAERLKDLTGQPTADHRPPTTDLSGLEITPPIRSALLADYIAWNRERAASLGLSQTAIDSYELANPLFMSVDGILRYLKKKSDDAKG